MMDKTYQIIFFGMLAAGLVLSYVFRDKTEWDYGPLGAAASCRRVDKNDPTRVQVWEYATLGMNSGNWIDEVAT